MNSFISICVLAAFLIIQNVGAFRVPISSRMMSVSRTSLAATPEEPKNNPAVDALRAKMAADPNYDPMKDPEAMSAIESMIPEYLRDLSGSLARLEVAFKDANTSLEGSSSSLNQAAALFEEKKGLISSPNSEWFQKGFPEGEKKFDKANKEKLAAEIAEKYPEVPRE